MAKITKIEAQKRQGRYNVYLDGKYAFPVAECIDPIPVDEGDGD